MLVPLQFVPPLRRKEPVPAGIRSLYLRDASVVIIIPVEGSVANLYETRIPVVLPRSLFNGGGAAELRRRGIRVSPAIVRRDERWWSWLNAGGIVRDYLHAGQLRLFRDCTASAELLVCRWVLVFLLEFMAAFFLLLFFFIHCEGTKFEEKVVRIEARREHSLFRGFVFFNGRMCRGLDLRMNVFTVR